MKLDESKERDILEVKNNCSALLKCLFVATERLNIRIKRLKEATYGPYGPYGPYGKNRNGKDFYKKQRLLFETMETLKEILFRRVYSEKIYEKAEEKNYEYLFETIQNDSQSFFDTIDKIEPSSQYTTLWSLILDLKMMRFNTLNKINKFNLDDNDESDDLDGNDESDDLDGNDGFDEFDDI
jgi:hypothetical protein